ncbi:MAG: hypothetical protein QOD39_4360 [Mycobacterium sp.]|jgi:uncharacterized Ntn-hydrolase superfamily protein|nr:hypothetical protein [Mycobacterium sp.]
MTFSVLAHDPVAGHLGVASQSHYLGVGAVVTWAEAGAGAIATQAFADAGYGARGTEMMREAATAPKVLARLLAEDATPHLRQVAMLDRAGTIATYTGRGCVPAAGEARSAGVVAIGNTLDNDAVPTAIIQGYNEATGDLAHRLVAAMQAGEAAGGDIRGRQSAALRVVKSSPTSTPWVGVVCDLRVDDHSDPLPELARLLELQDVFDAVSQVVFDPGGAVLGVAELDERAYRIATERLAEADQKLGPNPEAALWAAVVYARAGQHDLARRMLDQAARRNSRLPTLFGRMPEAGILTEAQIVAVGVTRQRT